MIITFPDPQPDEAIRERTERIFKIVNLDNTALSVLNRQWLGELSKLIEDGICLEARDDNGDTPLHVAAIRGHREAMEILLTAGAKIEAKDNESDTPLHKAAGNGNNNDAVEALLKHGAEIEAKNNSGKTPLHYVAWYDYGNVVEALLKAGAEIEVKDNNGFTPLYWAAWDSQKDAAEVLLAHGANIYVRSNDGVACIDYLSSELPDIKVAPYQQRYAEFAEQGTSPASVKEVYELLCAWPLIDPDAPVDRAGHLRQLFAHAQWESPAQAERIANELRRNGEDPVLCAALHDMARPVERSNARTAPSGSGMIR